VAEGTGLASAVLFDESSRHGEDEGEDEDDGRHKQVNRCPLLTQYGTAHPLTVVPDHLG